jgi:hypothetical protein
MGMPAHDLQQWRLIATIETHASFADLHRLIARDRFDVRLDRVVGAPSNCHWFDVLIDAGDGDGRYARTASAVLRSLHRATDAGRITDFRLADGNQWLTQCQEGAAETTEH